MKGESAAVPPNVASAGEVERPKIIPDLTAGLVTAFVMLSFSISYGTLVFDHSVIQHNSSLGVRAAIVSTIILLAINSLMSSFSFSLAGPDSNSTVLLAGLVGSIASILASQKASQEEILGTILLAIGLSTFMVGFGAFSLAVFRQGRKIAFIPFPVLAGFLAGTGLMIILGGLKIISPNLVYEPVDFFSQGLSFEVFLAGAVALGLLIIPRFWNHFLVFPAVVICGIIACHFLPNSSQLTSSSTSGLNPGPSMSVPFAALAVNWKVLWYHLPHVLPLFVVVIFTSLINSAGLDLDTAEDGDFDRELRGIGLALMVSGFLGGMTGHVSAARSILHRKAGASSRMGGLFSALVCTFLLFFFPHAINLFPRPILGALLIYNGLAMLKKWAWDSFRKLPFQEFFQVMIIMALVEIQGPLLGGIIGTMIATIFFVYSYSRIECIQREFSCGEFLSNRDRHVFHLDLLKERGKMGRALILRGYVFFGTANDIQVKIGEMIKSGLVRFVLIDFKLVQGMDFSAAMGFCKLENICVRQDVALIFSNLAGSFQEILELAGFNKSKMIKYKTNLDFGLEWMENQIIKSDLERIKRAICSDMNALPNADEQMIPDGQTICDIIDKEFELTQILAPFHLSPSALDDILAFSEVLEITNGTFLIRQNDESDAIYFVEKGLLLIGVINQGKFNRFRTVGPGSIVGEMAFYTGARRSAEVKAQTLCRVRKLTREGFQKLKEKNPIAGEEFQVFVIKLLAWRLTAANTHL